MTFNTPIDLRRKQSEILVVHCSDPRFQSAYRDLIDSLGVYYDLMVLPGACKAIADDQNVVSKIVMLQGLHHFKAIHIFDHIHCGAFGQVNNERTAHQRMMNVAKRELKKVLPEVKVTGHLVGVKQTVAL